MTAFYTRETDGTSSTLGPALLDRSVPDFPGIQVAQCPREAFGHNHLGGSMKKLALFALVLSSMSFATSIRSVALESIDMPLRLHGTDSAAKIIRVAGDGEVFGGSCDVKVRFGLPGPGGVALGNPVFIDYSSCEWKTVKFMAPQDMRDISRDIRIARRGGIRHPQPGDVHCLAIPMRSIHMTADNGTVFLKSGSYPCGGSSFNVTKSAQSLVQVLNDLRTEYNKLVD